MRKEWKFSKITMILNCEKFKICSFKYPFLHTNMYIIGKEEMLVVDPNISDDARNYVFKCKPSKMIILLTHEHSDHINGVPYYQNEYSAKVICTKHAKDSIAVAKNNRPKSLLPLINEYNEAEIKFLYQKIGLFSIVPDESFEGSIEFDFHGHEIQAVSLPGHAKGACCIFFDKKYAFTGDYMIPNVPVILRYPGCSKKAFYDNTLPFLLSIRDDYVIMPGHGEPYIKRNSEYVRDGCWKVNKFLLDDTE